MHDIDELRELADDYLGKLPLCADLGRLEEALRYSLLGGGKRIRPVLCLATGEALGRSADELLPAACSLELVHTFSLVHDDLPALDDDDLRRGQPSAHVRFGEAVAILSGDALLTEAFRLILAYPSPGPARELAAATLGMIGGQYVDITTNGKPRPRRSRGAPPPEDREAPRRLRRVRARGGRRGGGRAGAVAALRRRGRPALPDRRRHPRRHRHRGGAREDAGQGRGRGQGDLRLAPRPRPGAGAGRRDAEPRRERARGARRGHDGAHGARGDDPRAPG